MANFIEQTINSVDPSKGLVCDLFAGSGTVSFKLANDRAVAAVDIQEYSRVICSALLNPFDCEIEVSGLLDSWKSSKLAKDLLWAIEPLDKYEKVCIYKALNGSQEELCDLLENGSIVTYELKGLAAITDLKYAIEDTSGRLQSLGFVNTSDALAIRHFGGLYFSYYQSAQIDCLLHHIHQLSNDRKDTFLAALLSTISDSVNTVGKQFAQPIKPRRSNGQPKPNIGKQVIKDRGNDIFNEFESWLLKYLSIIPTKNKHQVLRMDYSDALDSLKGQISVVYADPPYTRDHYSRFYHALETVCLRDNPKISTVVLNGSRQISRGVYREERYQSPFCIKSQAPKAFETMFSKVSKLSCPLILSYSPYDVSKNAHPRLLTMEQILSLANKYFKNIEVLSPGKFSHSKLNHADKHLESSENAEVLVVCQESKL